MACACETSKTRTVFKDRGLPPQPVWTIQVTVASKCHEVADPGGGDDGGEPPPQQQGPGDSQTALELAERARAAPIGRVQLARRARRPPAALCVNVVAVTLDAPTTAGFQISEVVLGGDTFAAAIAVGGVERWVEPCDPPDCEQKPVSVTVVDAQGNVAARLGGFKACRCAT
jgi:hypothetical protein